MLLALIAAGLSCRQEPASRLVHYVSRGTFEDYLELDGTVEPVNAAFVYCDRRLAYDAVVVSIRDDGETVQAGDTVCVLEHHRLTELIETLREQIELKQLEYDMGVANLESEYASLEAQAKENEIQAVLSTLDSLQLDYYTPTQRRIAELNLKSARIRQQTLDRKLAALKVINEQELKMRRMELSQAGQTLQSYEDMQKQLVLTAPSQGTFIVEESPDGTGKYRPGDALNSRLVARIPDLSRMQVRLGVPETVYKRLMPGQPVEYRFDGMPGNVAWGRVESKASVGEYNGGVTVYDVVATIDSVRDVPGNTLTAHCRILLNCLPDTLSVPIVTVFDDDSAKVVYRQEGKDIVQQEIKTGPQSSGRMVVTRGLEGGECLLMLRPDPKNVKRKVFLTDEK